MSRCIFRLLATLSVLPAAFAQTGGIQGIITTAPSAPIPGAAVSYRRVLKYLPRIGQQRPKLAAGEASFTVIATTDNRGNHYVTGLPPGDYTVCVNVPGQPYLDPCLWGGAPYTHVRAGQTATVNVILERGVFLSVHVNDPQALLPISQKSPLDFGHLKVGVIFGKGAFLAALRVSARANAQDYRLAVRVGVPLQVWAYSAHVTLDDAERRPQAASGAALPFQATAGVDHAFTIHVTGKAHP